MKTSAANAKPGDILITDGVAIQITAIQPQGDMLCFRLQHPRPNGKTFAAYYPTSEVEIQMQVGDYVKLSGIAILGCDRNAIFIITGLTERTANLELVGDPEAALPEVCIESLVCAESEEIEELRSADANSD